MTTRLFAVYWVTVLGVDVPSPTTNPTTTTPTTPQHTHTPQHPLNNITYPELPKNAPVGPCLPRAGRKFCTVQLFPGGVRYIVSKGRIRALKDAPKGYQGFSLPYCCDGRASRLAIPWFITLFLCLPLFFWCVLYTKIFSSFFPLFPLF